MDEATFIEILKEMEKKLVQLEEMVGDLENAIQNTLLNVRQDLGELNA